jgi:hypothetical protein
MEAGAPDGVSDSGRSQVATAINRAARILGQGALSMADLFEDLNG